MAFRVEVVKDSLSPEKARLTTVQATLPKFVLAQLAKHGMLCLSSESSRAIKATSFKNRAVCDPYLPLFVGKARPGMGAIEEVGADDKKRFLEDAFDLLSGVAATDTDQDVPGVQDFHDKWAGIVAKETVNRYLEPWLYVRCVITATEWTNFFAVRTHGDTQDDFRLIARAIYVAMSRSTPKPLDYGEWHLPFVGENEAVKAAWSVKGESHWDALCRWSVARCARASYGLFDGKKTTPEDDERTFGNLMNKHPRHVGPTEHQGRPLMLDEQWRPSQLKGWQQYRKFIVGENITEFNPTPEEVASWGVPETIYTEDGYDPHKQ